MAEKLSIVSQRFLGIPPFRFYALADGIQRILLQTSLDPIATSSAKFTDGSPARLARCKILRKLLLKLLTTILLAAYKLDELKTGRWPGFNLGD